MKNKTSRTNSMKLKKVIAASLAVFILFAFTGCKTSSGSATTESSKQEDTSTTDSSSSGDLNEKLNDLYQQENQIFADHKDVWDKAFGFMSKNIDDDTKLQNLKKKLPQLILPAVVPPAQMTLQVCFTVSKGKTWMVTM